MFYKTGLQKFETCTKKGVFTDHKVESDTEVLLNESPPNRAFNINMNSNF